MKAIGKLLREKRVDEDKSMRDLAQEFQLSPMMISNIENGKKFPTKGESKEKVQAYLDLSDVEYMKCIEQSKIDQEIEKARGEKDELQLKIARKFVYSDFTEEQLQMFEAFIAKLGADR
jgi:transcriptional regulator with XRE-family HTH domain